MVYYPFWGMNALWWVFWLIAAVVFLGFAVPVRRARWRELKESEPLLILQRRYAAGEITTEEYQERKLVLERDRWPGSTPPSPRIPTQPSVSTAGAK
jgi:putative membrane protein